ncbi:GFA family protein [Chromohalobacter israelensis]|uniref:GFA family protein n=1 Tax=Chromohalobacter israelensis TaxID=141390 RepID=UPI003AF89F9E
MTDHLGSCLCGTVKFEVHGQFDSFYLCHCVYCQKDTGSAYAANLFSQSAKLAWIAGVDAVTSFTLPGTRHSKSFCKLCGSALPSTQVAGLLVVPAGVWTLKSPCCQRSTSLHPARLLGTKG